MPGIFGVCDYSRKLTLTSLAKEMTRILCYNSFLRADTELSNGMVMGKVNLGLGGVEDTVYRVDELILAWHGKIFNLAQSTHSAEGERISPELCRLYRKQGPDFISGLKGSFAIAIFDEKHQVLVIGSDRFGTRPVYCFAHQSFFVFCSEIKGFLALPGFEPKCNYPAMADLFAFGFLLEEKTLLEDVNLIPPGSILVAGREKVELKKYWKPCFVTLNSDFHRKKAVEECYSLLSRSVRQNMEVNCPAGLFLSGGLDSRLLAGMARNNSSDLNSYTFGTKQSLDAHLAAQIAKVLGIQNIFYPLSPDFLANWGERGIWYTEGMSNCLNFAGIEVLPEVRNITPVVMNGYGGNEFLGFLSGNLAKFYYRRRLDALAKDFYSSLANLFSEEDKERLFTPEVYREMRGQAFQGIQEVLSKCQEETPFSRLYNFMLTQKARRLNLLGMLMDHSHLEYLLPFYDYDWSEFALRLPEKERLWARFYRYFLSEKFPVLSRIVYQRTGLPVNANLMSILGNKLARKVGLDLSERCLRGKTASYVEYPHWTRTELKSFILEILNPANLSTRDFLNPGFVRELLKDHFAGAVDNSSKIGLLLTFEIWHRQFVRRKFPG